MEEDDAITIDSDEEVEGQQVRERGGEDDDDQHAEPDRRAVLTPVIQNIVSALGGLEQISPGESVYILGDSCLGCLKDLKKVWRKDDTDDERTVARIFWEVRVLQRDLVPILLETAGKGKVEDRCALACADLITAMTWPIDVAEELKEMDDEIDTKTDYTTLIQAQRSYKAALLRPGAISAIFSIMLPAIAKSKSERTERDGQIINLVLHCFRNLVFIKDPPPNAHASGEQAEYAALQSKLIHTFNESNVLDALLAFASNSDDVLFNPWNNLVLEIFYLLFRGVKPGGLIQDQGVKAKEDLRNLLAGEAKKKREDQKFAPTRHSRFGTTVVVQQGNEKFVMHRQSALTADTSKVMDLTKKKVTKGAKQQDDLGTVSWLSVTALNALQGLAKEFMRSCFNRFLASLLKDIRMERAKISEKDNLRLLFVSTWFLEFFLSVREREGAGEWSLSLVKEVVDEEWVKWVLRRMRDAADEKPKLWKELHAGIDCLAQLLLLIEAMSTSDRVFSEAASTLQHKLYYNGEILDLAFDNLSQYKQYTSQKSIAYLDSSIHLSYVLLRVLEKWAKAKGEGGAMVVRKKKKKAGKKRAKGVTEEEGIVDVPSEEDEGPDDDEAAAAAEDDFKDSMLTFEAYETRFAHPDVTATYLTYLGRYQEFDSPEKMKWVVGLLHRQVVKVKAEGLFFRVTTLELFNRILKDEKTLPKDQSYLDLMALIKFVLRKFFKAVAEDSFILVESFFPRTRRAWKKLSGYKSPDGASGSEGAKKKPGRAAESKHGAELTVKRGYTASQQLGIAIACLVDAGKMDLIDWVKEILMLVIGKKQRIITDTDDFLSTSVPEDEDEAMAEKLKRLKRPSAAAIEKFEDDMIPYVNQEKADAATKDANLKLVFRLCHFFVTDEDAEELEWYVPAAILPDELQTSLDVIEQFLKNPLDLNGKKAADMLSKKRKPGRTRRSKRKANDDSGLSDGGGGGDGDDDDLSEGERRHKKIKRAKKKAEEKQFLSAEFIEDSDADLGNDEEFYAKEQELRDRAKKAAETGDATLSNMAKTGTKKRKKKLGDGPVKKKFYSAATARGAEDDSDSDRATPQASSSKAQSDAEDGPTSVEAQPKPRPRPRPRLKASNAASEMGDSSETGAPSSNAEDDDDETEPAITLSVSRPRSRPKARFGGGGTTVAAPSSSPSRASSPALLEAEAIPLDKDELAPGPRARKRIIIASDEEE
ncbi:Topoisomerase 1-associated factor 1 [Tulasnella sp. JGI-2019a]|nr:Topoisomerase 1-associated factor 1 [Tulasnella sp. JGI-2019a]